MPNENKPKHTPLTHTHKNASISSCQLKNTSAKYTDRQTLMSIKSKAVLQKDVGEGLVENAVQRKSKNSGIKSKHKQLPPMVVNAPAVEKQSQDSLLLIISMETDMNTEKKSAEVGDFINGSKRTDTPNKNTDYCATTATAPGDNMGNVLTKSEANAALIAAAPELLEACQAIMKAEAIQQGKRDGGTMGTVSIAIDAARAAIAKAEGKF